MIHTAGDTTDFVNLDKAIFELQTKFTSLSWLEHVYGRAQKAYSRTEKSGILVYPEVYTAKGEYFSMMPNDRFKSYCFFIPRDKMRPYQYLHRQPNTYIRNVDLVFYFDYTKIGTKTYPYSENLLQDVLNILRTHIEYKIINVFEEVKNVFAEFSFDEVQTQFLKYPFGGFRVAGELSYTEDIKDCE